MNNFPALKGNEVRWDVLVFGHLRWNRYFGETPENPPRGKDLNGRDFCLIVDPAIRHSPEEYYFDLNRRTGVPVSGPKRLPIASLLIIISIIGMALNTFPAPSGLRGPETGSLL